MTHAIAHRLPSTIFRTSGFRTSGTRAHILHSHRSTQPSLHRSISLLPEIPMFRYPSLTLMLVALAVRILAATQIPALTYDGVFYLRQAMRVLQGSYVFEGFPPGLPLVVALFGFAGADLEFVARCINIVAGVASVGLAYSLARYSLGPTASFVLSLLLAIHVTQIATGCPICGRRSMD
jgi:hypothetical protein